MRAFAPTRKRRLRRYFVSTGAGTGRTGVGTTPAGGAGETPGTGEAGVRGKGSDGFGMRTGGGAGAGGGTGTGRTDRGVAGATRGNGSMRSVARGATGGTGVGTTRSRARPGVTRSRGTVGAGTPLPRRIVPGSTGAGRIEGGEGSAGGGATLRGI